MMYENVTALTQDNFTSGGEPDDPPTHQLSEYITVSYQFLFLIIGVPLNFKALHDIIVNNRGIASRFNTFKLNLVITDLLILLVHTVSEAVWIITFTWHGGAFLCKLVKFADMFSFISHANIVVSIAADRAMTIWRIDKFDNSQHRLKIMLSLSWLLALLASIPQFFVWTTDTPFPGWTQCATVWEFEEFFGGINRPTQLESIYASAHLVVVFYLPATLMFVAYIFTFIRLRKCQKAREMKGFVKLDRKTTTGGYSVVTQRADLLSEAPNCLSQFATIISVGDSPLVRPKTQLIKMTDWMSTGNPRIIRQTILIAVCYILCFAPYNLCALWRQIAIEDWRNGNYEAIIGFLEGPIVLNAVIDPILYKIN